MAGAKILLVEDNVVNRRLAEFLLRSQGYQVLRGRLGRRGVRASEGRAA